MMAPVSGRSSRQDAADALVRRRGAGDHVAHESDDKDGEDQDGEIAVERGEVAEGHASPDHESSAERQDGQGRHVGDERDDRDHGGEQPEDPHARIPGFRVGGHELVVFHLLGIQDADERRSQDAFIDDLVEPIDHLLPSLEEHAHFPEHDEESASDDRNDAEHRKRQPPIGQSAARRSRR